VLCVDHGVWHGGRVQFSAIRHVGIHMSLPEQNFAVLNRFGLPPSSWEPQADCCPFMRSQEIMDVTRLCILNHPPRGDSCFFPFTDPQSPPGPCLACSPKLVGISLALGATKQNCNCACRCSGIPSSNPRRTPTLPDSKVRLETCQRVLPPHSDVLGVLHLRTV